jgi:hypothetical protein
LTGLKEMLRAQQNYLCDRAADEIERLEQLLDLATAQLKAANEQLLDHRDRTPSS